MSKSESHHASAGQTEKVELEIMGCHLSFVTEDAQALREAAQIVQSRLRELQRSRPLSKSRDLKILLMIEQAMKILELEGKGKALLKHTEQLVNYVNDRIKEC